MEEKGIHNGHRQRVKADFLKSGYNEDTPAEKVLEHLLFYCIPRRDTVPVAKELLNTFGSLSAVFDAKISELTQISGITENTAVLLKLILPTARIYNYEKRRSAAEFTSVEQIGDFLTDKFVGSKTERLAVLGLDALGRKLFFEFLANGNIESVGISIRDIVKLALDNDAVAIVIAHNHPSGVAIPSCEDEFATAELAKAMKKIGMKLIDHIVIADGDYVSMRQSAKYAEIFKNPKNSRNAGEAL